MKNFIKSKKKWVLLALFIVAFATACTRIRNADGTIDQAMLIYLDTPYGDLIKEGWFNIFVWPIAQLINIVAQHSDAGIGIVVVTVLLNVVIGGFTTKQQASTQKMQMIQPELNAIQAKYANKKDQQSQMRQANEMQALYKKYDINPMGSMVTMFIQFPIIIAVYQAVQRAWVVSDPNSPYGSFLGVSLLDTPMTGIKTLNIAVILIFVLMIICQFLSMKVPQYLQKRRNAKNHVKTKDYAKPKKGSNDGIMNSMNMTMYMSLGMIVIFAINWPLGMSFYWLVNSFVRIIQQLVIDKFFIK